MLYFQLLPTNDHDQFANPWTPSESSASLAVSVLQNLQVANRTESEEAEIMSCIKKYNENALGNSPQTTGLIIHTAKATMQQRKQINDVQGRSKHKNREQTREETMFERV